MPRILKGLLATWLLILAVSILLPLLIEPTGDGFTRALNRFTPSLWLHFVGLVLALWSAVISFRARQSLPRKFVVASFAPLSLYLIVVLFFIGLIMTA